MNKFSAEHFYRIGCLLGNVIQALNVMRRPEDFPGITDEQVVKWLRTIEEKCRDISLIQSAKFTRRLLEDMGRGSGVPMAEMRSQLDALQKLIHSEMEDQLFLWVPSHRSEFYSKNADDIVGAECCARFPSIRREIEESNKCYAVGRYTASAFHLMRATEAGVKALAKAISAAPKHDAWKFVFEEMKAQVAVPLGSRQTHWRTHGEFLHTLWADMRAIAKEWRNGLAHSVDTYSEEEAKQLLGVIPVFLRHLATKMDETGKLY